MGLPVPSDRSKEGVGGFKWKGGDVPLSTEERESVPRVVGRILTCFEGFKKFLTAASAGLRRS